MLKLYGGQFSRAAIVRWYLEELGIPYEFVLLDMKAGEHKQPEFLAINPVGKVPAIVDGGFILWESGAILLYLAEKYGDPSMTLETRSHINQWINYGNATMGPEIFAEATRESGFSRHMGVLNQYLETHAFLVGDQFGAADVAVGALLGYIPLMLKLDFAGYPAVQDYLNRLSQRPAYQKAIAQRA
jgi:glutathione S-transferase